MLGKKHSLALLFTMVAAVGCERQLSEPASEEKAPEPMQGQIDRLDQISSGYPGAPNHHPELTRALEWVAEGGERLVAPPTARMPSGTGTLSMLGFLNLGISSDVWAHGEFAYVGGLGEDQAVRVVDISDPSNPHVVSELPAFEGSPQDVKVASVHTSFFGGDLAVVVNDGGAAPTFGGIQLWDVTDPHNPVELSHPRIGAVHNAFLFQRDNRVFVLLAIPLAEVFSGPSAFEPVITDFAIVEVTDPRNPQLLSDWGAGRDGGFSFGFEGFPGSCDICRGSSPVVFNHDVWTNRDGTIAYLSYWDLGLILLDISDPSHPRLIGRGIEPPTFGSDEGNANSAVPARGGDVVLVADEDFEAGPWGFLRVFDTTDPTHPSQIGAFATPGTLFQDEMIASAKNIIVRGNFVFLSWNFEGIRVLRLNLPNPVEFAAFTPPPDTGPGLFWGVYVRQDGLILGSDVLSGLFILELSS